VGQPVKQVNKGVFISLIARQGYLQTVNRKGWVTVWLWHTSS